VKFCCLAVFALITAAGSVAAVSLERSPIHRAVQTSIASDSWRAGQTFLASDNEFGPPAGREASGRKSVFRAGLYSALIPGAGQYYLGNRRTARYFFAAEAFTWIGYISLRSYGNWRRDDYINYAAVHAGAQLEGKSDEFLSWVGFYNSIRDFNNLGRAYDPERSYLPNSPENYWEWRTDEERQTFRDLRNSSKEAYRRSEFMIGLAIVDRVVSVVEAVRSASRINRRIGSLSSDTETKRGIRLSVDPWSTSRQVCVTVYPGL